MLFFSGLIIFHCLLLVLGQGRLTRPRLWLSSFSEMNIYVMGVGVVVGGGAKQNTHLSLAAACVSGLSCPSCQQQQQQRGTSSRQRPKGWRSPGCRALQGLQVSRHQPITFVTPHVRSHALTAVVGLQGDHRPSGGTLLSNLEEAGE